jgi:predicted ATPase
LKRRVNANAGDRQDQRRRLLTAFHRTVGTGCQLVTVVGDAGIGKMRLAPSCRGWPSR